MATIKEILKNSYQLTFDTERDYDWMVIAEIFAGSENIESELHAQQLIDNNESKEKLKYWQDLFFMEIAERGVEFDDSVLLEKIKKNSLFKENVRFINQLPKATTELGRELLIDGLIDNKDADQLIPDHVIENVFKKKTREDLRKQFDEWSHEGAAAVNYKKYASYRPASNYNREELISENEEKNKYYKIWVAIAAILVIGFFVWQPTKSSDSNLFENYAYNDIVKENIGNVFQLKVETTIATRGGSFTFEGFSKDDSQKAMEAILLIKEGEFLSGKSVLINLDVGSKMNDQLLFFLALAQSNSGDEKEALAHFNDLGEVENFIYKEDVEFQIAMTELKIGNRKEAKLKLAEIVEKGGKYKGVAEKVLGKIKWF